MEHACYDIITVALKEISDDLRFLLYKTGAVGIEDQGDHQKIYTSPWNTLRLRKTLGSEVESFVTQIKIPIDIKEANFEPYPFLNEYEIVPANQSYNYNQNKIALYHGSGFGTGLHPTTILCGQVLTKLEPCHFTSVLDFGAGNGILSILSNHLGYLNIHATEILEEAKALARKNFEINQCQINLKSDIQEFDIRFDLIVANILGPTLLAHSDILIKSLNDGGTLIVSGFRKEEENSIRNVFDRLKAQQIEYRDGWGMFMFGS